MRNDSDFVQDSRVPGKIADSCAETQPASDDVFQAAALLVGVYGQQAVDYAMQQKDRHDDESGTMVWELILTRIEVLLYYAPSRNLN